MPARCTRSGGSRLATRSGLTTVAATCAVALFAGTAGAVGTPGGESIGDPYYPTDGNTGYDVGHYDLRLSYAPGADTLSGTATILATPTRDLSSLSLDFGLTASSVLVNNTPARFAAKPGKLVVTPRKDLPAGTPVTVVVRYAGVPSKAVINGERGWVATRNGALAANEPHSAAFWYPVNDHPKDKATYDISVAVPKGTEVVSNGTLLGSQARPANQVRWYWRSTRPQASYLTLLAIGRYELHRKTAPNGQPFVTAYDKGSDPATTNAAKASIERTPEIHRFESTMFGPYPFEAKGGVSSTALGFALETQTRPVHSDAFFHAGSNTYVVAHENAHQWFGDSVSMAGWRDIWLNEGFASYAEWLWSNHVGEGTPRQLFDFTYHNYQADDPFWQVLPGDPGKDKQFDDAVYDRGAMTLQALRNVVGDKAFFATRRAWAAAHRYGNGTIEQFVTLAEKTSGTSLTKLFDTWLYTRGKPAATAANGIPPANAAAPRGTTAKSKPHSYDKIASTHRLLAAQRQR
jgi:aminopeptidase N